MTRAPPCAESVGEPETRAGSDGEGQPPQVAGHAASHASHVPQARNSARWEHFWTRSMGPEGIAA